MMTPALDAIKLSSALTSWFQYRRRFQFWRQFRCRRQFQFWRQFRYRRQLQFWRQFQLRRQLQFWRLSQVTARTNHSGPKS